MKAKYREIAERLRATFAGAAPDTQLPAEAVLARLQRCSLLTLRRALAMLAAEGSVRRVHGKGTFVAAPAAVQPTPLVLYWGPQTGHLYSELFDAFSRRLNQYGYGALVLNPDVGVSPARVEELLLRCLAAKPVAVVVLGATEFSRALLEKHRDHLPPLYFILRRDYPCDRAQGEALVDGALGGWQVAEHLYALGHRRVMLFVPTLTHYAADVQTPAHQLTAGLTSFAQRHRDLRVMPLAYARGPLAPEIATLLQRVRTEQVTAVVTAMDFMAVEVMRALQDAGLRVPADVSVTGFIRTPWADAANPPLTTVAYPLEDVASTLAAILAGNEPAPCARVLVPRLCVGRSTAVVHGP